MTERLQVLLWFAVRLYAITLIPNQLSPPYLLWFAVRLYAITLFVCVLLGVVMLWFAVRLYAITLQLQLVQPDLCCGLRSGYMRLHYASTNASLLRLWFAVRLYAITLN